MSRSRSVFGLSPLAADVLLAAGVVPWLAFVATQIEPEAGNRAIDAVGWACIVVAGGAYVAVAGAVAALTVARRDVTA